jgi:parallel beta-helix repeat protein
LKKGVVAVWGPTACFATGFIIHPDGYIITAAHAVDQIVRQGAPSVRLSSGAKYPVAVIGRDDDNDLALLKVSVPEKLPVVRLGDSDMVRTQDKVMIIGFPAAAQMGCEKSVADPKGVVTRLDVTATQRVGGQDREIKELIEISESTAIPGNSGGPVFNIAGDVIGVVIKGGAEFTIAVRINKAWGLFPPAVRQFLEQHPLFADDFTVDSSDPLYWLKKGWFIWPLPELLKVAVQLACKCEIPDQLFPAKANYEGNEYSIEVTAGNAQFISTLMNTEIPVMQLTEALGAFFNAFLRGQVSGDVSLFASPRVFRKDFRVRVKAQHVSGPVGLYGLMFRIQGKWNDDFYVFVISNEGFYGFAKKKDQQWDWATYAFSPHIRQGMGVWNTLEVEAHGPGFSLFVNGQLLTTISDAAFQQGFVALYVVSDQPGIHVHFDDFAILPVIPTPIPPRPQYAVCPSGCLFNRIAPAIQAARAGDTITIGPGIYNENLVITKSVALRGAGQDQTIIRGTDPAWPVIQIESEQPIEVAINSLTIADAKWLRSDQICAVAEVPRGICPNGIQIGGKVKVAIQNSTVSSNGLSGIWTEDSSQATIKNSMISRNLLGIVMLDSSQATIENSTISGNEYGGIFLGGSAQASISDNRIFDNKGYGVALALKVCGSDEDYFQGKVEGRGNQIYNNQLGNLCPPPGQYPWPPGFGGGA